MLLSSSLPIGLGGGGRARRPSTFPELACTYGTGIVPLCHQAVSAWQAVDGRADSGLSPLAAASVQALGAGLVTAILARDSGGRWCEITMVPPAAAQRFASLFPKTRFLAVHRRAETFVRSVLDASPWGLAGAEFAPFLSAHPANTTAALATYWASRTAALLEFGQANPSSCLRVRVEDLHTKPQQTMADISDFLDLGVRPTVPPGTGHNAGASGPAGNGNPSAAPVAIPPAQIPPPLLAQLNGLHQHLAYPPVNAAIATDQACHPRPAS
jgi:Sulfotransferase family